MTRPIHVLLVEDNPADADLTREILEAGKLRLNLTVATDGSRACSMLQHAESERGFQLPDLIILDLNLPRMDGREVLATIKNDPRLRRIPVVVLTSSDAERDIAESYDLGANCYLTKPLDLRSFEKIVQGVENFWFTIVQLPPSREG